MISREETNNLMLFKFILNSAQDSIFTKNREREYTYINPAMAALFGCCPEDLLGKKPSDVFGAEDAEVVTGVDDRTFEGQHVSEQRDILIGDRRRVFHTIQSPIYDDENRIVGICGIVRDLTEFHNLQEKLLQAEKIAATGQLAAGVAHEFNNILSIILLNAQALTQQDDISPLPPADRIRKNLNNIIRMVNRGQRIVGDLTSFIRPAEPDRESCRIETVIDDVVRLQEPQLVMERIRIVREYDPTPELYIDRSHFEQVFVNLLTNARHAIIPKESGEIRLRTRFADGHVMVSITDDGIGMDAEVQNKIFNPFFTTKGAFAKNNLNITGTGLGLPIVFAILEKYGSTIRIESRQGEGTNVVLTIPAQGVTDEVPC